MATACDVKIYDFPSEGLADILDVKIFSNRRTSGDSSFMFIKPAIDIDICCSINGSKHNSSFGKRVLMSRMTEG